MALLILTIPIQSRGQIRQLKSVAVLPFSAESGTEALADEIFTYLCAHLKMSSGYILVSSEEVGQRLDREPVGHIIRSVQNLLDFTVQAGFDYIVAGHVERSGDGQVHLSLIVFGREEKEILNSITRSYVDEAQARGAMEELGRDLSRPRIYQPSDTAVLASMIVPGLGQFQKGRPVHGLISLGLVTGALVYWAGTPTADQFHFRGDKYSSVPDYGSGTFTYYIYSEPVSQEEYFLAKNEDYERGLRAAAERRAVQVRTKRAVGLFCAAYLFNLVDVVLLSGKTTGDEAFFLRVRSDSTPGREPATSIRLQFGVRFR